MTAAGLTAYNYPTQHIMPQFIRCYKITASDWIDTTLLTPTPIPGFIPLHGFHVSATTNTVATDITYGAFTFETTATGVLTATSTSFAVDTIAPYLVGPRTPPFYIMMGTAAGFEIAMVTADSLPTAAASTWTVIRGCLGTTPLAAYVADEIVGCMLNVLVMTDAEIGNTIIYGIPLPNDPKAPIFQLANKR
jgi:hypothetical protein